MITIKKRKRHNPISFIANRHRIRPIVLKQAKRNKSVVYGAQATNVQTRGFIQRRTFDYDVYAKKPKRSANTLQHKLDRRVSMGHDDFYMKPAFHKGTWKVMYEGRDGRPETRDDVGIADYSKLPKRLRTKTFKGVRYESLPSIVAAKKRILKDKESAYRHKKDKEDLERIRLSKRMKKF